MAVEEQYCELIKHGQSVLPVAVVGPDQTDKGQENDRAEIHEEELRHFTRLAERDHQCQRNPACKLKRQEDQDWATDFFYCQICVGSSDPLR